MMDEPKDPLAIAIGLGVSGASLSGAIAVQLWRQGLLPDDVCADFERRIRQMSRDFADAGMENAAAQMSAVADEMAGRPAAKGH